jgi:sensor domain CHASE-containing protein
VTVGRGGGLARRHVTVLPWDSEFFDAKVALPAQDVRLLRQGRPTMGGVEAIYYDKPTWWLENLADVSSRHVWFIEHVYNGPYGFPAHWQERKRLKRGYVQYRLAEQAAR